MKINNNNLNETCAYRLLQAFLEIKYRLVTTGISWTGSIDDPGSISIVYRRFMALAGYMGLSLRGESPPTLLTSFEEGDFIKKRPAEKYEAVTTAVEEYAPMLLTDATWENDAFQFKHRQLKALFIGLVTFKLKTDFRYFGPGEGLSPGGAYAHYLRTHVYDAAALLQIDTILAQLVDPEQRVFEAEQLVAGFGYPTEDYEAMYMQERIDEAF